MKEKKETQATRQAELSKEINVMRQEYSDFLKMFLDGTFSSDTKKIDEVLQDFKNNKMPKAFHNTGLLLRNYKKIVWLVECFPEFIATELAQPLENIDKLLARVDGELAFGNKKLDKKLESIEKTRMVLELVNDAISVLQKMPKGENLYQVIYLTYATQEDLTIDDILYRLNISRKKYYLLRDQAIALISIRLWTSADKDLAFWLELLYVYENRKNDGGEDD